jgi:hypothetical protein
MPRNTPDVKASRFRRGQRTIPERQINALVDGINKRDIGSNAPQQVVGRGAAGGSPVLVLSLVTHNNDYLVCEDSAFNTFSVAKPYELRRTPFDTETINGVTYTYASASERSATDGVDTETQYITPDYVAGHEIYAIKPKGGTGLVDGDTNDIIWLEVNQGRAWAADESTA